MTEGSEQVIGRHVWRLSLADEPGSIALAIARPCDDTGSLMPDEALIAREFKAARRAAFATGRALARSAMTEIGVAAGSVLRAPDGAP
ncbi:MAG: hypothetical protein ACKOZX_00580, partial [Gammaproteobacteria bacterium]